MIFPANVYLFVLLVLPSQILNIAAANNPNNGNVHALGADGAAPAGVAAAGAAGHAHAD